MASDLDGPVGERFNLVIVGKDLVGKSSLCDGLQAFASAWRKLSTKSERSADVKAIQKAVKEAAAVVKKRLTKETGGRAPSSAGAEGAPQLLFQQQFLDIRAFGRSTENSELNLQISCLDFPGRIDVRSAHSFFYPLEKVVFVVAWSLEDKDLEDTHVERWLQYVRSWRPEAPIILIGTHLDKISKKADIPAAERVQKVKEAVATRFQGIEDVYAVSNASLDGFDVEFVNEPKEIKLWKEFADALKRESELLESLKGLPFLMWNKVLEVAKASRVIAATEGDFNLRKLDAAVEWLTKTGQFIDVNPDGSGSSKRRALTCNLEWLGNLFARACGSVETNGAVTADDLLHKYWHIEETVREEDWTHVLHYVEAMQFIAPSLSKTQDYYVPSVFPLQRPENIDDFLQQEADSRKAEGAMEKYRGLTIVDYMPDGLFSRVLSTVFREAEGIKYWRNGAVMILQEPKDVMVLVEWRPDKTGVSLEAQGFGETVKIAFDDLTKVIEGVIKVAPGVQIRESATSMRRRVSLRQLKRTLSKGGSEIPDASNNIVSPRSPKLSARGPKSGSPEAEKAHKESPPRSPRTKTSK